MKGLGFALVAMICALFPMHAGAVDAVDPDEFISEAVDQLAERLNGRRAELSKDRDALYALIDEVLLPRLDRELAARQVLAKHWRSASDDQRQRFVAAFYTILVQRYADGILDFEHDRVKVNPFKGDTSKRTVKVKTSVYLEDGSDIDVIYTLVPHDSGWKMFDVSIEGVSFIRSYRVEFSEELQVKSLEQVIARLENEASGNGSE